MKHLNIFLVAVLLIVGVGVSNAQDKNNPWAIGLEFNVVDTYPVGKSADGRLPLESKDSFNIDISCADVIVPNNGTYDEFEERVLRFGKIFFSSVNEVVE